MRSSFSGYKSFKESSFQVLPSVSHLKRTKAKLAVKGGLCPKTFGWFSDSFGEGEEKGVAGHLLLRRDENQVRRLIVNAATHKAVGFVGKRWKTKRPEKTWAILSGGGAPLITMMTGESWNSRMCAGRQPNVQLRSAVQLTQLTIRHRRGRRWPGSGLALHTFLGSAEGLELPPLPGLADFPNKDGSSPRAQFSVGSGGRVSSTCCLKTLPSQEIDVVAGRRPRSCVSSATMLAVSISQPLPGKGQQQTN